MGSCNSFLGRNIRPHKRSITIIEKRDRNIVHVGVITVKIGIDGYGFRNVGLGKVNQISNLILICDTGSIKDLGQLHLNPSLNVRTSYLLLQPLIKVGNLLHGIVNLVFLRGIFNRIFPRIILDLLFLYRFRLAHLGTEIQALYLFFKEFSVTKLVIDLFCLLID